MDAQATAGTDAGIPADYLQFYDELTGLYNRRFYNRTYPEECARAAAEERALGLVLVNVDHVGAVNERYGQEQGDNVLVQVGALVNEVVGEQGFPVRYAGDEFVVLLPETPREGVIALARQITERAGAAEYVLKGSKRTLQLTVSTGVACFPDDVADVDYLLDCAGQAVYKARWAGGNQVAVYLATDDPVLDSGTLHHFFPCPRFVGRDDLVRTILEAAPTWAMVSGPAGSGRTRVLDEVASGLEGRLMLRARGMVHRADQPFGMLLEAVAPVVSERLPQIAAVLDAAEQSALARLIPELRRLTAGRPTEPPSGELPPDPYVEGFLHVLSVLGEPALLLDDAQWADRGTLLVLEALRARSPQVFACLAVRSEDLAANRMLGALLDGMMERGEAARHDLEPLPPEQIQEMIEAVLPGDATEQPGLMGAIVERAQGRPLAVEEALKYLVQCGLVSFGNGVLQVGDLSSAPIPEDDEALLLARVGLMHEEVREALALGAMLGPKLEFETLKVLLGREEGYVRGIVERGRKLHVLGEEPGESHETLVFQSSALHRALIRAMIPEERQKVHARIGRLLERMYTGSLDPRLADLWWHADQAAEGERAQQFDEILRGYRAYRSPLGQDEAEELMDLVTDAALPETMLTKAVDLARNLKIHLQNIRMYGTDHVIRKGGFAEVKEAFDDLFSRLAAVSYSEADNQILVNGNVLPQHLQYGTGILEQFQYYGIKGLTFRRGLTAKEIQTTLELMCLAREEVRSRGGVGKMLADVGVVNVTVNEKVYVVVGDKDILVKNKATGQEMLIKDLEGNEVESPLEADELFTIFRARDHVAGDVGSLKDSLDRVTALLSNLPTDGEGGAALSEIDPAELRKLLDAQAEVAEWYKEIARYIDMNFLRALDRDWAVLARDMESGNRIKIAAASRAYLEGGEESITPLIRLIASTDDTRARRVAVSLLRKLTEEALDLLLAELFNAQLPDEKVHLLLSLEDFQDASIAPKMEAFVQHPVREVRRAAMHLLTTKGQGLMGQALLAAMESDREDVKADAIHTMGEQKLLLAVPPLLSLIKGTSIFTVEGNENVQAQAVQALGEIGDVRAVQPLIDLVSSKKGIFRTGKASHVRAAAALALTKLMTADNRDRVMDVLEKAADDRDVMLRSAAKLALDNMKRAQEEASLPEEERMRRAEQRRLELQSFDPDVLMDEIGFQEAPAEPAQG